MTDLHRLHAKLCRELAQSERSALVHPRREARRYAPDCAPAIALEAISAHADAQKPRFAHLLRTRDQGMGLQLGRAVGELFSLLRHGLFDHLIDDERSYRGTLLGVKHGLDCARLLREVALREGDLPIVRFCDELLVERQALLERAEQALAYFADQAALGTTRRSQPNASHSASATPIMRSSMP